MYCPGVKRTGDRGRELELPAGRRELPLADVAQPDAAALPEEEGEQVADQQGELRARREQPEDANGTANSTPTTPPRAAAASGGAAG